MSSDVENVIETETTAHIRTRDLRQTLDLLEGLQRITTSFNAEQRLHRNCHRNCTATAPLVRRDNDLAVQLANSRDLKLSVGPAAGHLHARALLAGQRGRGLDRGPASAGGRLRPGGPARLITAPILTDLCVL